MKWLGCTWTLCPARQETAESEDHCSFILLHHLPADHHDHDYGHDDHDDGHDDHDDDPDEDHHHVGADRWGC